MSETVPECAIGAGRATGTDLRHTVIWRKLIF
jgi:hypothetical protein